jgi:hypothetical protein
MAIMSWRYGSPFHSTTRGTAGVVVSYRDPTPPSHHGCVRRFYAAVVGYFGSIVLARTNVPLARQDGMTLFGFRHRTLRDLGHDWQIVETTGRNDPPDLVVAATRLVETTGAPVLAAYVNDADCALLLVAVPNGVPSVAHLPDVTSGCETTYVHRPAPVARTADSVVKDLVEWAEAGSLSPSPDDIAEVVGPSGGASRLYVQDLVFDLVRAVGLNRIGDPRRHAFPIERYPFGSIANGLGQMAAHRAGYRADVSSGCRRCGRRPTPPRRTIEGRTTGCDELTPSSLDTSVLLTART